MRKLALLAAIVFTAALAAAQMVVYSNSGLTANQGLVMNPPPLAAPLLSTPTLSLAPPQSPVGASNATGSNVAGATSATLSIVPTLQSPVAPVPGYYIGAALSGITVEAAPETAAAAGSTPAVRAKLNRGAAVFQSAYQFLPEPPDKSLAEIAAAGRRNVRATHVYTNDDIARMNQRTGSSSAPPGMA